jgi:uncharacterized protein (DUF1800 family)
MRRLRAMPLLAGLLLGGGSAVSAPVCDVPASDLALLNRLSWGISPAAARTFAAKGYDRWLDQELRAGPDAPLPAAAKTQVDRMRIAQEPMIALALDLDAQDFARQPIVDPAQRKAADDAYNQAREVFSQEAATRSILRALYSPTQLRERMTWFWFNQFNVKARKRDIPAMIGDYEDRAIRPHALGRYRDLLGATLRHPAMLRYLDNDQNAIGRVNENYARELLELHSMGTGPGYTQKDIQELARILTGVGVSLKPDPPRLKPEWQPLYRRAGLFEFNPARHDFGDKSFLGHDIKGAGLAEVEQALDIIAAAPATSRHVSRRIATYFMGEAPPEALVERMASTFRQSDGDIAAVLRTLLRSSTFKASLGQAFKDPLHYILSAVRFTYDEAVIANPAPLRAWLTRLGEEIYGRETPDGYPLTTAEWAAPGQMTTRFEFARHMGHVGAGLLNDPVSGALTGAPFPVLQDNALHGCMVRTLSPATRSVLGQAVSPRDWNVLFLSSPEFMRR